MADPDFGNQANSKHANSKIENSNDVKKTTSRLRLAGLGGRTLAILVVLILLVAGADRAQLALDFSPDRRYTLDPDLVQILKAQSDSVEIVTIWENAAMGNGIDAISEGLALMAAASPRVNVRHIDPILHKPQYEQHRKTFGDGAYPAIYLTRGNRAFKIPVTQVLRRFLQREIGGGLLALAETDPPVMYILSGHGELTAQGGMDGLDAVLRAWQLAGFRWVTATTGAIPADSVVVLAGPTTALGAPVIAALNQHLIDGGSLLVCADDRMPVDLSTLLRQWGILSGPAVPAGLFQGDPSVLFTDNPPTLPAMVVVSRARHVDLQDPQYPYANLLIDGQLMSEHPALAGLAAANRIILSPWTTPVWQLDFDPQTDGELIQKLTAAGRLPAFAQPPQPLFVGAPGDVWTTQRSEPPKVPADLALHPPLPLAVAATYRSDPRSARQGEQAHIVVWGSRAAIANSVLARDEYANADALVAIARWLANRGAANPIPASESAAFTVTASEGGMTLITALLVAIMPCLAIGGALLAWLHRR